MFEVGPNLFVGNDYGSLTSWLRKLGIQREHEDIVRKRIPELLSRKEYDRIEKHNADDLNTSEELHNKLRLQFPDLLRG